MNGGHDDSAYSCLTSPPHDVAAVVVEAAVVQMGVAIG